MSVQPDPAAGRSVQPESAQATIAVDLRNVSVRYGGPDGLLAVDDVSATIRVGEFVSLVGPSGCGKTSLLRVVGGCSSPAMAPCSSSVRCRSQPISASA